MAKYDVDGTALVLFHVAFTFYYLFYTYFLCEFYVLFYLREREIFFFFLVLCVAESILVFVSVVVAMLSLCRIFTSYEAMTLWTNW